MILLFRSIGKTDGTICLRDFSKGIVRVATIVCLRHEERTIIIDLLYKSHMTIVAGVPCVPPTKETIAPAFGVEPISPPRLEAVATQS